MGPEWMQLGHLVLHNNQLDPHGCVSVCVWLQELCAWEQGEDVRNGVVHENTCMSGFFFRRCRTFLLDGQVEARVVHNMCDALLNCLALRSHMPHDPKMEPTNDYTFDVVVDTSFTRKSRSRKGQMPNRNLKEHSHNRQKWSIVATRKCQQRCVFGQIRSRKTPATDKYRSHSNRWSTCVKNWGTRLRCLLNENTFALFV